jgi:hypothetical protein
MQRETVSPRDGPSNLQATLLCMRTSRGRGSASKPNSSNTRRSIFRQWPAWIRAFLAVVMRPHLWPVALRQAARIARPHWWKQSPFLPLPDAGYLRFRLETAYGEVVAPKPDDLVSYLEWCRSR